MVGRFLREAAEARRQSGKSVATQTIEALELRFGSGQLGLSEYHFYRLHEARHDAAARAKFAGWRRENAIDLKLNHDTWRGVANDKLLFYSTARGLGLPHPAVRAVFDPRRRFFPEAQILGTTEEAAAFLRDPRHLPVFMKPVWGSYGRGACSVVGHRADGDRALLGNGDAVPLAELLRGIDAPKSRGYVFQDLVSPHEFVLQTCGPRVSSVRVVVLLTRTGPRIFRAAWKIPCGKNMSDNFMHGHTGNLLAEVDVVDGMVRRVIRGVGLQLETVDRHPDTGQALLGHRLPFWPEIVRVCSLGSSAYPGLRLQHWDVALGANGPVLLEVNVEGSMDLHQLAGGAGILDAELLAELENEA